ncbi:MAG: cytochrome c [Pseudomonadota bacterium]
MLAAVWAAGPAGADERGREIFIDGAADMPACAICHTLADAGAAGDIGPNLDKMDLDIARVRIAVHDGVGVMPPFGDSLTAEDIDAVASYVAAVAGQ